MSNLTLEDLIKEEMCSSMSTSMPEPHPDHHSNLQNPQPPYLPFHPVDVEALFSRPHGETWNIDCPLQQTALDWTQLPWFRVINDALSSGTPSEASSSTISDIDTDLWSPFGSSPDDDSATSDNRSFTDEPECLTPDRHWHSIISISAPTSSASSIENQAQCHDDAFTNNVRTVECDKSLKTPLLFGEHPELQQQDIKPDLSCIGKAVQDSPKTSRHRKAQFTPKGRSPSPPLETSRPISKNKGRPVRKQQSVSSTVTSSSSKGSQAPTHHHSITSVSRTSSSAMATGSTSVLPGSMAVVSNPRTRSRDEREVGEELSHLSSVAQTPVLSNGFKHFRRSSRYTSGPQTTGSVPSSGSAVKTRPSKVPSCLGKRPLASHEESNSDESDWQPSPKPKRQRTQLKLSPKPSKPAKPSKKLGDALLEVGFTKTANGLLLCTCQKTFTRAWDASRHWNETLTHKLERFNDGDDSSLFRAWCKDCEQFLSRQDSLARHKKKKKCGMRLKRDFPVGVDKTDGIVKAVRITNSNGAKKPGYVKKVQK